VTKAFEEIHMRHRTVRDSTDKLTPPLAPGLPVDQHDEELLDEALTETFPASDPIAIPAPDEVTRSRPAKPKPLAK
jgi:hypothetical protein